MLLKGDGFGPSIEGADLQLDWGEQSVTEAFRYLAVISRIDRVWISCNGSLWINDNANNFFWTQRDS